MALSLSSELKRRRRLRLVGWALLTLPVAAFVVFALACIALDSDVQTNVGQVSARTGRVQMVSHLEICIFKNIPLGVEVRSTPLSRFLADGKGDDRDGGPWVVVSPRAEFMIDPEAHWTIQAEPADEAWAKNALQEFVLDPQTSCEVVLGEDLAYDLRRAKKQGTQIDWSAWREYVKAVSVSTDRGLQWNAEAKAPSPPWARANEDS